MDSSEHTADILDKRCREAVIGTGWEPKTEVPGQARLQLEGLVSPLPSRAQNLDACAVD
jgi:hypothetical protein